MQKILFITVAELVSAGGLDGCGRQDGEDTLGSGFATCFLWWASLQGDKAQNKKPRVAERAQPKEHLP